MSFYDVGLDFLYELIFGSSIFKYDIRDTREVRANQSVIIEYNHKNIKHNKLILQEYEEYYDFF